MKKTLTVLLIIFCACAVGCSKRKKEMLLPPLICTIDSIGIEGVVSDNFDESPAVKVDGTAATVADNGSFIAEAAVTNNTREIVITATDNAAPANTKTCSLEITNK